MQRPFLLINGSKKNCCLPAVPADRLAPPLIRNRPNEYLPGNVSGSKSIRNAPKYVRFRTTQRYRAVPNGVTIPDHLCTNLLRAMPANNNLSH